MKPIREFLGALSAPFYALVMNSDHRPKPYHAAVWFSIFIVSELVFIIADGIGLRWNRWERLADVALFASLLCRLALVEHALSIFKDRSKDSGTQI